MAYTVRRGSFKDGDYLATDHILSADYGFGCEGGNKSPHLAWSGGAPLHQALRCHLLRSGCTHRQRVLALVSGERPTRRDRASGQKGVGDHKTPRLIAVFWHRNGRLINRVKHLEWRR
jgi:hypothetical protein